MKKKIIHLIGSLNTGGAETLITDYAIKHDKTKFDILVVVATKSQGTINEKRLNNAGIKTIFIGNLAIFSATNSIYKRIINKLHRYILFRKTVKREKPHIIHTHLNTNDFLILINTIQNKINLFHTVHSNVENSFKKFSTILPTYYCIKRKGMIPIALHSKMKEDIDEFFNISNSIIVPNAIDLESFKNVNSSKRKKFKRQLSLEDDAFIVGHVGRFTNIKNHKFLINVFKRVKRIRPNAQLLLIGTGQLEKQIKEQVIESGLEESVHFLGERQEIPELMNIMDVLAFPSKFEGFGNVLIEAQAVGLKCVVSNAIPNDAFITNLVIKLSLSDSFETWAETISDIKYPNKVTGNLEKYDINNVIKYLENLYLSSNI